MLLRPMHADDADVEAARTVTVAAFDALDRQRGEEPVPWSAERCERFAARTRHFVEHDPGGCWLAEHEGRAVGVAVAVRREGLWGLSLLTVRPEAQNLGVGRALLDRAAAYGKGCLRGMITSSTDPKATRRYRKAGFTLYPTMRLHGRVDRSGLPDPGGVGVHEGSAKHLDLLDSVDRRVRGAGHGPDHRFLVSTSPLLVVDTLAGSGYCYLDPTRDNVPVMVAATSRRLAARLLAEALARFPADREVEVRWLTAEQEWAVDVGMAAGLAVGTDGFLCLRGMKPPQPYLPTGPFL
jgi:GNAT superfamily N-acetyltransferase